VIDSPDLLPRTEDLVLSRVELESRGPGPRLLIDFIAYAPGIIDVPPIEIASFTFRDLRVEIASILAGEDGSLALSGPAPLLPAPGTAALIYGTVFGIILLILGAALGGLWGIPGLRRFWEKVKRRRLIASMKKILGQLRNSQAKRGPGGEGEILARLSAEFRSFLCFLTGTNCRVLVPREFLFMPVPIPGAKGGEAAADSGVLSGRFLRDFFSRCDTLRFSGMAIGGEDVYGLLDEAGAFIKALEAAEKAPSPGEGRVWA
jgi:hypothetical protein